jgi:hypothetical protein
MSNQFIIALSALAIVQQAQCLMLAVTNTLHATTDATTHQGNKINCQPMHHIEQSCAVYQPAVAMLQLTISLSLILCHMSQPHSCTLFQLA